MAPFFVLQAENATPPEQALEMFFKLGLPDAKGAKWVTAYGNGFQSAAPGADIGGNQMDIGNAWLVKEESDGTVELIINQSERIRVRKTDGMAIQVASRGQRSRELSALPQAIIRPADLEKVIAGVKEQFEQKKAKESEEDSNEGFKAGRFRQNDDPTSVARTLLFLAQLERQGRGEFAKELLPAVLARGSSPADVLDSAISLVANGRVGELSANWMARGDSEAFANGLEALAAEFSRGWSSRPAALLLARRARGQTPTPEISDPATQEAAKLLLTITPENFRRVRGGANWLLPGSVLNINRFGAEDPDEPDDDPNDARGVPVEAPNETAGASSKPATAAVPPNDPVNKLLSGKRAAVAALAGLLGDHRLVRARRAERTFQIRGNDDDELSDTHITQTYNALSRPMELGELATDLLLPVLPESIRNRMDRDNGPNIIAWLKEISGLSDEQLAWDYLRNTSTAYDPNFRGMLGWLVNHGNDETITKLKDVFLDKAVWQMGSGETIFPLLDSYLKRLGSDRPAFQENLKKVYKTALEQNQRQMQRNEAAMNGEMKKQFEAQMADQLKRLDYVLKPRGTSDLLAEIATADEENWGSVSQAALQALIKLPFADAEGQIYQNAAKAKTAVGRQRVLFMALRLPTASGSARRSNTAGTPEIPADPVTRAAISTLLSDESSALSPNEVEDEDGTSIANYAALALMTPRLSPEDSAKYGELFELLPSLATSTLKKRAQALLAGNPAPPWPDDARIPEEKSAKLAADLGAHPPGEIFSSLHTLAPDEQVALAKYFAKAKEKPPSLIAAQFTIAKVNTDPGKPIAGFNGEHWKGRHLDAALVAEVTQNVEKMSSEGHGIAAAINAPNQLSGLTLIVRPSPMSVPASLLKNLHLPGLSGKPTPEAVVALILQSASQEQRPVPTYNYPVWKDPTITMAWRKENLEPNGKKPIAEDAPVSEEDAPRAGAALYEKSLKAIFDHSPDADKSFRLIWSVTIVEKKPEP